MSFFGRCSAYHNTIRALVATVAGTSAVLSRARNSARSSIVNSIHQVNNIRGQACVKLTESQHTRRPLLKYFTSGFGEDLVGCFGPDEWSAALVPAGDQGPDLGVEVHPDPRVLLEPIPHLRCFVRGFMVPRRL